MTNEIVEPEVKTTYEYVLDLKERLNDTCELAQIAQSTDKTGKILQQKHKRSNFSSRR